MITTEMQTAQATTVADLYESLVRGDAPLILDIRNADDVTRWHIEGRSTLHILNIPYSDILADAQTIMAKLPHDRQIVVVCAKGISAQHIAVLLREHGMNAEYLAGGMQAWGAYYDVRTIADAKWGQIIQIARPARGDLSFMIVSAGEAALIDPLRHIQQYTQAIAQAGARLSAIFDTHVHADHISGGPALSQASSAPYYVHPYDAIHPIDMLPAQIAYTPLIDGQVFHVGHLTITVIWYPGHTLGQVNFLVEAPDGARFLFTGDGIFLRSFGRPDLGGKGEAWTPMLYDSMVRRLPPYLTDATMILPAHFSSLDECDQAGRCTAPWSIVQQTNDALSHLTSAAGFADFVLSNLPVFPPQYVEIKRVNIGLSHPTEEQAEVLELGKNICAVSK